MFAPKGGTKGAPRLVISCCRTMQKMKNRTPAQEDTTSSFATAYWKIFNFVVRRVVAVGFVLVGIVVGGFGVPALLPGGTTQVDGVPSDDLVLRLAVVLLPLLVTVLGVALYRAEPFNHDK